METTNKLKELRNEKKLTLDTLSSEIGISKMNLSRYERGENSPKPETWKKLAEYFGVSQSYLMGIEPKKSPFEYLTKMIKTDEVTVTMQELNNIYREELIAKGECDKYDSLLTLFNFTYDSLRENDGGLDLLHVLISWNAELGSAILNDKGKNEFSFNNSEILDFEKALGKFNKEMVEFYNKINTNK